jgi:hypothetical protein
MRRSRRRGRSPRSPRISASAASSRPRPFGPRSRLLRPVPKLSVCASIEGQSLAYPRRKCRQSGPRRRWASTATALPPLLDDKHDRIAPSFGTLDQISDGVDEIRSVDSGKRVGTCDFEAVAESCTFLRLARSQRRRRTQEPADGVSSLLSGVSATYLSKEQQIGQKRDGRPGFDLCHRFRQLDQPVSFDQ